jgi:hypothetical protein
MLPTSAQASVALAMLAASSRQFQRRWHAWPSLPARHHTCSQGAGSREKAEQSYGSFRPVRIIFGWWTGAGGRPRRRLQPRQSSASMLPVRPRARDQWADAASTPGNPHEWSRRLVRTRPHRLRSQALAALTRSWTTADICHLQTTPRDRALSPAALGSDDGRCRPAAISNAVPAAELTMSIRAWVGQRPGRPITGELVSVSTAIRSSSVRRRWQTRCRTARCNP